MYSSLSLEMPCVHDILIGCEATVYTRLLAALFYMEYGLYFACGLYAQRTQRDKVFAWAVTEFQSSSRTANAIWQWAKVRHYHVLIDKLPSSDEEDFIGFEQ